MADSNNLLVLTFEGAGTAAAAYEKIEEMEKDNQLAVVDAIIIEREATSASVIPAPSAAGSTRSAGGLPATTPSDSFRVTQTHGKKGKLARRGGGIGFLVGWLFGGPVGGLVVGASIGAIAGALKDFGISDDNIATIKARLQPNSSALLILGRVNDQDAFLTSLRSFEPQVAATSLTPEVERQLRERLGSA